MRTEEETGPARVTYRASLKSGGEVELRCSLHPRDATVQDAWRQLSAAYRDVDPSTLEIETRPIDAEPNGASGLPRRMRSPHREKQGRIANS